MPSMLVIANAEKDKDRRNEVSQCKTIWLYSMNKLQNEAFESMDETRMTIKQKNETQV